MRRKLSIRLDVADDARARALLPTCARRSHCRWITFTRAVVIVLAPCLAASLAHAQVTAQAAPPQSPSNAAFDADGARRILDILSASSSDRSPQAAELEAFGFDDPAVTLGRALPEFDPNRRAEFARSLAEGDPHARLPVLRLLTFDEHDEVRAAALESLRHAEPDPALRERIRQMAESEESSLVRGYARLLAADWGEEASALRFSPALPSDPAPKSPTQPRRRIRIEEPAAQSQAITSSGDGDWMKSSSPARSRSYLVEKPRPQTSDSFDSSAFPHSGSAIAVESLFGSGGNTDATTPSAGTVVRQASSTNGSDLPLPANFDSDATLPTVEPLFPSEVSRDAFSTDDAITNDAQRDQPLDSDDVQPNVLRDPALQPTDDSLTPLDELFTEGDGSFPGASGMLAAWDTGAPLGFAGPSGVLPTEGQESSHFVPVEDRWRVGFPEWDRYDKGHPPVDDYPYVEGQWFDPFNQNVLKGDYPVIGQHTFLNLTGMSKMLHEFKELPTGTTPFESTADPFQEEFFGDPFQYLYSHFFSLRMDLFHGNAAFKPADWLIRFTPVFNMNYLDTNELAVVNPDVRDGTTRFRTDFALEEWFAEAKIADLGPGYDFASIRAGSQFFNSDFRGFIFSDTNRAVRLFGTRLSNRDQFNIAFFDQAEKETNSTLNTFDDRHQNIFIANYYRQDFIYPGYTAQVSFHYNHDKPSMKFDENDVLVRPDPAGVFQKHTVDAYYLGFTGDGHIGRYNLNNAFYWVLGQDSLNPIASRSQEIDAKMAAVELSYDRDWARFRTSYFFASGDPDANDNDAEGFDAIFDNPNFAGGEFTYWQRQAIRLFNVNLTNRQSLVPNLRSSKIEGQSNFVNPGLHLINAGMDFDITPKIKLINNVNFLWFDTTRVLETFTFQDKIDSRIGTDISMGLEYRPLLNDNIQIIAGLSCLIPGAGFDDLFGEVGSKATLDTADKIDADTMYSHFIEMILIF